MLKTRVIPTLLWKNVGLVKGIGFNSWRRIGSILPAVKVFNTRQVDELMVLDITASSENRDPDYNMLSEIAYECFVPLTVGGGIKNIEQIKQLLRSGADKVSINSAAFSNPNLITEAAEKFGSQCIVASIDVIQENGQYICCSYSGSKKTNMHAIEWAIELEKLGAGEILLTDVKLDGTMQGYNIDLIKQVCKAVKIPVIASGGAGKFEDFSSAIKDAGASALAAASVFQFTEMTPLEIKQHLAENNIPVRNSSILI